MKKKKLKCIKYKGRTIKMYEPSVVAVIPPKSIKDKPRLCHTLKEAKKYCTAMFDPNGLVTDEFVQELRSMV